MEESYDGTAFLECKKVRLFGLLHSYWLCIPASWCLPFPCDGPVLCICLTCACV
jgi:hypothetical protein